MTPPLSKTSINGCNNLIKWIVPLDSISSESTIMDIAYFFCGCSSFLNGTWYIEHIDNSSLSVSAINPIFWFPNSAIFITSLTEALSKIFLRISLSGFLLNIVFKSFCLKFMSFAFIITLNFSNHKLKSSKYFLSNKLLIAPATTNFCLSNVWFNLWIKRSEKSASSLLI